MCRIRKDFVQRSITHTHIHTYLNRTNTHESRIHASHTVHIHAHVTYTHVYTPRSLTTTALLHCFIGPFDFRRQSYDFFLHTRRHQTSTASSAWIIVITGLQGEVVVEVSITIIANLLLLLSIEMGRKPDFQIRNSRF